MPQERNVHGPSRRGWRRRQKVGLWHGRLRQKGRLWHGRQRGRLWWHGRGRRQRGRLWHGRGRRQRGRLWHGRGRRQRGRLWHGHGRRWRRGGVWRGCRWQHGGPWHGRELVQPLAVLLKPLADLSALILKLLPEQLLFLVPPYRAPLQALDARALVLGEEFHRLELVALRGSQTKRVISISQSVLTEANRAHHHNTRAHTHVQSAHLVTKPMRPALPLHGQGIVMHLANAIPRQVCFGATRLLAPGHAACTRFLERRRPLQLARTAVRPSFNHLGRGPQEVHRWRRARVGEAWRRARVGEAWRVRDAGAPDRVTKNAKERGATAWDSDLTPVVGMLW